MNEELILKPFERLSVSKIDTFEMCPRHYHYQYAYGIPEAVSAKQQQNRTLGEQVDAQIEAWLKAPVGTVQLSGAAAAVSRHYPTPGQRCVDVQRWVRGDWAGAPWVGRIDLLTGPSTVWGPLNRSQKHGLVRITDLKSTSDLKWAKDPSQIDRNRQLHVYASGVWRGQGKATPELFEVSQVVVERGAPYRCQSIARVSSAKTLLELEQEDRPLVVGIVASHGEEDTLALEPAGDPGVCERWYGYRCAFYERCHGKTSVAVPQSLGALLDAEAGRGSGGVGRTIDDIAAGTVPKDIPVRELRPEDLFLTPQQRVDVREKEKQQRSEEDLSMLKTPDAAVAANAKIEGENARYRPRTLVEGKSYVAIQGDRHGRTWEFRMMGDNWIIRVADKPGPVEATPGFFPVSTTDESAKGSVPAGTGARMDIIQLRALFGPFLAAWDEREASAVAQEVPGDRAEEDDIFGSAEKQVVEQTVRKAPSEDLVKELTSVGLTDAQARSLTDGGVTLAALRAGTVAAADLTRCRGIGKGGAEKILSRFAKPAMNPVVKERPLSEAEVKKEFEKLDKIKSEKVSAGGNGHPDASPHYQLDEQPEEEEGDSGGDLLHPDAAAAFRELQERVAELEGRLMAARLRVADLESRPQEVPHDGFVIYVGCRPYKGWVDFFDVIGLYLDRVAKARKVADVSQIDPGYTVPGLLYEALHADPPAPCVFSVSDRDQVWGWVRRYFLSRASEIVVASAVP